MDDLISRQAAIDALGEEPLVWHEDDAGEVAERNQWRRDVAAIKALPSAQPDVSDTNVGKMCEYYDLCRNGRDEKKLREELLSAQPGWIPCSERPPKVREWVLCQCRAGIMDVLRLTEDGNWNKNYPHAEYMSGFVIAWMPLPTPYREGR